MAPSVGPAGPTAGPQTVGESSPLNLSPREAGPLVTPLGGGGGGAMTAGSPVLYYGPQFVPIPSWYSGSTAFPERVVYVAPDGSDANNGLTPSTAKQTLAGGVAALAGVPGQVLVSGAVSSGANTVTLPAGTRLSGVSPGASSVTWSTDAGSGQFALVCGGPGQNPNIIDHLTLTGPGGTGTPTIGVAPAAMYGVASSGSRLEDVFVQGFYAGVCFGHDHDCLINTWVQNCYYGLYFTPSPPSAGSQKFLNVVLYSQARANVAIGNGNAMTGVSAIGLECGQAPVGYLIEAQTGGGAPISYNQMIMCGFESMGNACFLDRTSPQLALAMNHNLWMMSGNVSYSGVYQDATLPFTYAINAAINNLVMFGPIFGIPPGGTGLYSNGTPIGYGSATFP